MLLPCDQPTLRPWLLPSLLRLHGVHTSRGGFANPDSRSASSHSPSPDPAVAPAPLSNASQTLEKRRPGALQRDLWAQMLQLPCCQPQRDAQWLVEHLRAASNYLSLGSKMALFLPAEHLAASWTAPTACSVLLLHSWPAGKRHLHQERVRCLLPTRHQQSLYHLGPPSDKGVDHPPRHECQEEQAKTCQPCHCRHRCRRPCANHYWPNPNPNCRHRHCLSTHRSRRCH